MEKYNPGKIEKKWQKKWAEEPDLWKADEKSEKQKFYCLDMFPYPSGDGLHVGHVENYTATDIYSRFQRMNGKNVLHPIGWDAFGLPAENFAIKTGVHPDKKTHENIKNFTRQIKSLGFSYDWTREIDTSNPEYYKWTQWFFLLLYKNGLAYKKKAKVNWCENCKTVLANEQVVNGECERCGGTVVQKDLEQWFFKITDFAEDLIKDLDKVDWPEPTKIAQKNWIGKSEGAEFELPIKNSESKIKVFTTRLDTVFGMTYAVIAPENSLIEELKDKIENYSEIEKYIQKSKEKTELERTELQKEKTGVELMGIKAINPFTKEEIPVFVGDYVLGGYGTGAVMAVPAHDERDWEFAKKYNLPIKQTIAPYHYDKEAPPREGIENTVRKVVHVILENSKGEVLTLNLKGEAWEEKSPKTLIIGGIEGEEKVEEAVIREIKEETGYKDIEVVKIIPLEIHAEFYAAHKKLNRYVKTTGVVCKLKSENKTDLSEEEKALHDFVWVKKELLPNSVNIPDDIFLAKIYLEDKESFTDEGILINSGKYDGLTSEKAREEMAKWLEEQGIGKKKINYRLRDWLVSRQRYWGSPIPIIYCPKCGTVPVPEEDLPVRLPTDVDFKPTGQSPLVNSKSFHEVKCPLCGAPSKRESDTLDTFVCSSWYYFRYADPKNEKEFASKEELKKWLPVDFYMGGKEHSVLHLLYARFFTKVLKKFGYIEFDEPFQKLRHQGIILGEDSFKMSKSRGNVINPDDIVKEFGADSLRLYEMFMGPLEDMKAWNTSSIVGLQRFLCSLDKIYRQFKANNFGGGILDARNNDGEAYKVINKAIKKVTDDLKELRFNTAISALMIALNDIKSLVLKYKISEEAQKYFIENYLKILAPFAPHICEEIWRNEEFLNHKESIFLEKWPKPEEKYLVEEEIEMIVQLNGKLRDKMRVPIDISEEDAKAKALESEKIKQFIGEKEIKKVIFVKGRLINIVI